ncbi:hypothetical protein [Pandoraea norimbergensis]|uniref:hypothetical protein n=1 Tax=Pandoraea norimbergensis TaxID=93219 RepID=UPI000A4ED20D|nr:hypothetical protein [Pandoraea norimbergensis]
MSVRRRPPVELHRLISALVHRPELVARLREAPDEVHEAFGIPADQRKQLQIDPARALRDLYVHPNLQFKYLGARGLLKLAPASIAPFLQKQGLGDGKDC